MEVLEIKKFENQHSRREVHAPTIPVPHCRIPVPLVAGPNPTDMPGQLSIVTFVLNNVGHMLGFVQALGTED